MFKNMRFLMKMILLIVAIIQWKLFELEIFSYSNLNS